MSKEDREYLRLLIREELRGWVEIPPDSVLNKIIEQLWAEFEVIYANDARRPVSGDSNWLRG